MAYLRWGEKLASGNKSRYFVIGSPDGLVNIDRGELIPYSDLDLMFKEYSENKLMLELQKRLDLDGEELEVVCKRLFSELNSQEHPEN